MSSIYICYASLDLDKADEIKNVFDLENITLSKKEDADLIFFIFTENAMDNEGILRDLDGIIQKNKKFITLQYTDTKPTDEISYYIATTQWHDMRQTGAMDKILSMSLKELR